MSDSQQKWSLTVRSRSKWIDLNLRDLWQYRDLIRLFVKRDFVAIYKQTILGPIWYLARPLITAFTYTVVFGYALKLDYGEIPRPVFFLAGIVPWSYFHTAVTSTSNSFITNMSIFGKVYFPRLVIPISSIISNLISFTIQLCLFFIFVAYYIYAGYPVQVTQYAFLFPVLVLVMMSSAFGIGLLTASSSAKYRDLIYLIGFGISLMMYLTPVIYPLEMVPEQFREWMYLNPMTAVIEGTRLGFLGDSSFTWSMLGTGSIVSIVLVILGLVLFSRVERNIIDTI